MLFRSYTFVVLRLPSPAAGYATVTSSGAVQPYGGGSGNVLKVSGAVIGAAATDDGTGGAAVTAAGKVSTWGTLKNLGSLPAAAGHAHVTAIGVLPRGGGYLLADSDGRVWAFGSATSYGDLHADVVRSPIVAILPSFDGNGYVLVEQGGATRSFGSAANLPTLNRTGATWPISAATLTGGGTGMLLADTRGHVFALGSARTHGDLSANKHVEGTVAGIIPSATDNGYTLVTSTGHAYRFGDASVAAEGHVSAAAEPAPVVAATR